MFFLQILQVLFDMRFLKGQSNQITVDQHINDLLGGRMVNKVFKPHLNFYLFTFKCSKRCIAKYGRSSMQSADSSTVSYCRRLKGQ
jgi:hypothetical protein